MRQTRTVELARRELWVVCHVDALVTELPFDKKKKERGLFAAAGLADQQKYKPQTYDGYLGRNAR